MLSAKNTYWVLRHGRSKANEAAIIVSQLENGIKSEYGLAEPGVEQAKAAGLLLQQLLAQQGVPISDVQVYSSPFSRTIETAAIAAAEAGLDTAAIQVTPHLRERCFGSKLELTCHQNYCPAWEGDMQDHHSKPCGCDDGESVAEVSARVQQLFQELEQKHDRQHILLVSHGDTLSILQATFYGSPLQQHRQYGLGTAELKQLNGSGTSSSLRVSCAAPTADAVPAPVTVAVVADQQADVVATAASS